MDKIEQLSTLYLSALQPDTVNQATAQLINIYKNSDTVFDHIFFVDHCDILIIRRYVILKLPALIKRHLSNFSNEQIENIKESLIRLISQEEDLDCRYFLSDGLISFMKKITKLLISTSNENHSILTHFKRIFDFGKEIIELPKLLSSGLYIWKNIFYFFQEFGLKPSEDDEDSKLILNLLFILLSISSTSLSSENEEDRLQSLKLIDILHDFLVEIENLNELQSTIISSLFQCLHQEFDRSVSSDSKELSSYCSVLCNFIEEPPDFVNDQVLSSFFELSIKFLTNSNLPIEKRYIIHTIIESSVDIIVNNDCYRSKINDLINMSISMSIELCLQDRNDNDYEFPYSFFHSISDALNDSESGGISTFELFMTFASNLAGNEEINQNFIGIQVSLFVVKSIIESLQEIVSTRINDVISFILRYGDINNENIIDSACQVIDELFEYVSSSASNYINEITSFLTKYSTFPISIRTLDSIFYRSDKPPADIEYIFKGLTEMININSSNDQIESLLSCITSLFSRLSTTEEQILSSFLPIINQIITSPSHSDLHSAIFDFFGRIVPVAPLTIKSDLSNLITFASDSFSLTDYQLNISISFFLRSLSKVLPISMSPYLPQVVPPLVAILQYEEPEDSPSASIFPTDNSIDNFLSDIAKSQREAMLTLCTFLGYCPIIMAEYAQSPILDFILTDKGGLQRFVVHACEGLAYAAEGCKVLGIPLFNVLQKILPLLYEDEIEKDYVFSILMLASEIVAVFGDVMPDDSIELVVTSLINFLNSPPSCFLLSDASSSSIDPQLQAPLFFLFSQSIDMFGEKRFGGYFDKICQILVSLFTNENKSLSLRCNAILAAAHLVFSCRNGLEIGTFCHIVQNASIQAMMSSQSSEASVLIAKAIKFLILADKGQLKSRLNMLVQFSLDVIQNGGYFGLLCSIVMVYNDIFDVKNVIEKINEFIQSLPPVPDSEDVVFYSEFTAFLLKNSIELEELNLKLPAVASSLFASSDKHFNSVDPEVRAIFVSVLEKLSEDALISLNKADESKLLRINNHMKLMKDD